MDVYDLLELETETSVPAPADSPSCQKIKLLKLMEIFRNETDEDHPMLASDVCKRLVSMGIRCDRRTLTRDIQTLLSFNYEIMSVMVGHEKAYYVEDRTFTIPELKILIDAVQAASFITEGKTTQLIENLASLGGLHTGELLRHNMVCFNTRKHSNESIFYNVDRLEKAILQKRKVTFRYFHLNEEKQRIYRKDGQRYTAEPVALVFSEDNYYLITYNAKHEQTVTYRVDRMDTVSISTELVCTKALILRDEVARYTEAVFRMYNGEARDITLQFTAEVMDAIYDKFGENIEIFSAQSQTYTTNVRVSISPTFWGWLFQFGSKVKILAPTELVAEYKAKLQEQLQGLDD